MIKSIINDTTYEVEFNANSLHEGLLNGQPFRLDEVNEGARRYHILHEGKSYRLEVLEADYEGKKMVIRVNGNQYPVELRDQFDQLLRKLGLQDLSAQVVNDIKAPMPGLVLRLEAAIGDEVQKGDALLVLEAMKMENVIKSPTDGKVKTIKVSNGEAVEKNQILLEFE